MDEPSPMQQQGTKYIHVHVISRIHYGFCENNLRCLRFERYICSVSTLLLDRLHPALNRDYEMNKAT